MRVHVFELSNEDIVIVSSYQSRTACNCENIKYRQLSTS